MRQTIKEKPKFFVLLALILLLIVTGFTLIFRVFDRYEKVIIQNADDQLMGLTHSVDHSVDTYLKRYVESLKHITGKKSFLEAEAVWTESGDYEPLLTNIKDSIIGSDERITSIVILKDSQVILSTSGRKDYHFPPRAGKTGEVSIRPCVVEDGSIYLAFVRETVSGYEYAALVDLVDFYQQIAGNLTINEQDRVMLLDAGGQTLLHKKHENIYVELVREITEDRCEYPGMTFLKSQQELGKEGTTFYDQRECSTGEYYTARMAVVPATEESNGFFAIGVATNYDDVIRPMKLAAIRLLAYGSMVVIGVGLLLMVLMYLARGNQRVMQEVKMLREKNEAMEELNAQTQKLAHHQRLETLGTLTSGIAHEFNNLLTPIMGYSMLVLEKLPSEDTEIYDDVLEIYQTSRKAKNIVSRLSDLARKNANAAFRDVVIDELVRKTLGVAKPVWPKNVGIDMKFQCEKLKIRGNETQLSQLVLNLVLNSFHAMEATGGTLVIETNYDEHAVRIIVGDNGCGIPEDVLPHIFEPFYSTKEAGKGSGLGMAIVNQVVQDHDGKISVDSEVGKGTTITVEFPLSVGTVYETVEEE